MQFFEQLWNHTDLEPSSWPGTIQLENVFHKNVYIQSQMNGQNSSSQNIQQQKIFNLQKRLNLQNAFNT